MEDEIFVEEGSFPRTIFAIKTALGHEKTVAENLGLKAKRKNSPIFAIIAPTKLRGYVLVEGIKNIKAIEELLKGMQYVRGIVDSERDIELKEIEHYLAPKPIVADITEGDIVEIINGPFKGEKARVRQIDTSKEEITVELFEAMVSIPVTIKGDSVRVIEKEDRH
ncbi:MAG: transcription elongation factor Spt5 [Candidatus Thermoplasmatota archaeon]|nr:transcription elongation factor Spt5 [Candidatus Thermoplasmatota archaeon]